MSWTIAMAWYWSWTGPLSISSCPTSGDSTDPGVSIFSVASMSTIPSRPGSCSAKYHMAKFLWGQERLSLCYSQAQAHFFMKRVDQKNRPLQTWVRLYLSCVNRQIKQWFFSVWEPGSNWWLMCTLRLIFQFSYLIFPVFVESLVFNYVIQILFMKLKFFYWTVKLCGLYMWTSCQWWVASLDLLAIACSVWQSRFTHCTCCLVCDTLTWLCNGYWLPLIDFATMYKPFSLSKQTPWWWWLSVITAFTW